MHGSLLYGRMPGRFDPTSRDGTILIKDWCIGCGLCEHNCPYGNITMHERVGKASAAKMAITCDYFAAPTESPAACMLVRTTRASNEGKRVAENRRTRNALERKWLRAPPHASNSPIYQSDHAACRDRYRDCNRREFWPHGCCSPCRFRIPAQMDRNPAATSFLTQKCRAMSVLAVVPQRPATAA